MVADLTRSGTFSLDPDPEIYQDPDSYPGFVNSDLQDPDPVQNLPDPHPCSTAPSRFRNSTTVLRMILRSFFYQIQI